MPWVIKNEDLTDFGAKLLVGWEPPESYYVGQVYIGPVPTILAAEVEQNPHQHNLGFEYNDYRPHVNLDVAPLAHPQLEFRPRLRYNEPIRVTEFYPNAQRDEQRAMKALAQKLGDVVGATWTFLPTDKEIPLNQISDGGRTDPNDPNRQGCRK